MSVDSFTWLPRSLGAYYQGLTLEKEEAPWTPLAKPIEQCRFALLTTAGLYLKGKDPPFDLEREKREPFWGDPTYRIIPRNVGQEDVGAAHLHINTEDLLQDMNIALPIQRFLELEEAGEIGSLAPSHYSFMGYQQNTDAWRDRYGPEVARRMKEEDVDAALLTPV
ncbi:MAG: glycine/sarcosine/betaine reductase selenoprotein B family protein [Dehalococcoidia bacterium]